MATKRSLYKPAQMESVGTKETRSPLVQGRLVSKPLIPDTMTVYAASPTDLRHSHGNTDGDTSITVSHSGLHADGYSTPPRQSLANARRMITNQTCVYLPLSSIAGDTSITISHSGLHADGYSTPPRQSLANASMITSHHSSGHSALLPRSFESTDSVFLHHQQVPGSPPKPTPSDALDLSDGDDRHAMSGHTRSPVRHISHSPSSPVLMVDAGGRRMDPNVSEVEIMTNLVASPAKVVCHAPAVVESDLRNTGYTQETAKISVDSVPTVSLYGDLDVTAPTDHPTKKNGSLHRTKQPRVVKEKGHSLTSGSKKTSTWRDKSKDQSTSDESMQARETSASSVDNEHSKTGVQQHKKKKAKGRFVASRYMQSTSSKRANDSSTQGQSFLDISKKDSSLAEPMRRPPSSRPISKPIARKTAKSSSSRASKPSLSDTLMVGGKGATTGGITSTPFVGVSRLPSSSAWDASAIQPLHGMSTLMSEDMSMIAQLSQSDSPEHQKPNVELQPNTQHAVHHKKHTKDPEVTQDYLDRLYARYLQWVYIDTKLRKSFQEQEKDAMGQYFAMWCENEKMRKRKTELELEMSKIKHENHLDEQLEIQRSGLGPITANTEIYKQQYSTMANALDTTRHQLPLRGILVPDDEDAYQDALIGALDESERLLQQFSLTVGSTQQSKVTSFAKAVQTLENVVQNEEKELQRCQELLAATSSLTTHASSLQIQQLEGVS